MWFNIFKNALLIFFLIYGIISLAERLVHLFIKLFSVQEQETDKTTIVNIHKIQPDRLEYVLKEIIRNRNEKIYVLHEHPETEISAMLYILCRQNEQLIPVTKQKLSQIILKTDLGVFSESELKVAPE